MILLSPQYLRHKNVPVNFLLSKSDGKLGSVDSIAEAGWLCNLGQVMTATWACDGEAVLGDHKHLS